MQPQQPPYAGRPEWSHYDINRQQASMINNVGRDQYNAYVQRRESFLRDVASTRTKARWLVWIGLLVTVVGFGMFAAGVLQFLSDGARAVSSGDSSPPTDPFGSEIAGIPSGLLGWAIGAVGMLMLIIGIVLHVVATSRRKRVDREMPLPDSWPR